MCSGGLGAAHQLRGAARGALRGAGGQAGAESARSREAVLSNPPIPQKMARHMVCV